MSWFYLILAGLFEIVFAFSLKLMDGHKNIKWTVLFYISTVSSLYFLSLAMRTIPVNVAYAIWTAIGTGGMAIVGFFFLQEHMPFLRAFFLFLLILSIVGLKMTSK